MNVVAAFITGHSVRDCTGLSSKQRDFQRRSDIPLEKWLPHNFPYHETFPFPEPGLLSASCNNLAHYFSSRFPAFKKQHREAVTEIFSRYDAVILLAGSCGLELLNNLDLSQPIRSRLHVFAYGPVSRRRPEAASLLTVQGTGDWLSRGFHPTVDHRFPCPHMGYLQAPETLRLFNRFFHGVITS